MDKREMIERAFGLYKHKADWMSAPFLLDLGTLTEQAIVIECEVEHTHDRLDLYGTQFPMTIIKKGAFVFETLQGRHGTPGKAIAIIIPLEEE